MPVNKTMEQYAHYIAIACYVTKSASNWNHCDWITIPAESDRRKHESVFGLSCCGSNCTSIEYQRILVLSLLSIGALMKNEKKNIQVECYMSIEQQRDQLSLVRTSLPSTVHSSFFILIRYFSTILFRDFVSDWKQKSLGRSYLTIPTLARELHEQRDKNRERGKDEKKRVLFFFVHLS